MDKRFEQIPVSEKLDGVIDHCMEQLRKEQKSKRKNRVKRTFISLGTAAAVFVCAVFFGASNPNAAESIPLIGHITRLMQGEQKPAREYIQESNGVKITVSEVTHDNHWISMNVEFYSHSGFPEEMYASTSGSECGLLEFISEIRFGFYDQTIADSSYMKGSFTDENTYSGKINIPIDQRIPASARKDIKIPKEFDFTWNISIIYDWPYDLWEYALNEEKPYHTSFLPNNGFGGTWDFQFSIPLNVNQ